MSGQTFSQKLASIVDEIKNDLDLGKTASAMSAPTPTGTPTTVIPPGQVDEIVNIASVLGINPDYLRTIIGIYFEGIGADSYEPRTNYQLSANTDFYGQNTNRIKPVQKNAAIQICVCMGSTSKLNLKIIPPDNSVGILVGLNSGLSLTAGAYYEFTIHGISKYMYDFQTDTSQVITFFQIMELSP